jgi:hypothetical protein
MPDKFINWELLGNPANWLIVFLMLSVAAILVTVINSHATFKGF